MLPRRPHTTQIELYKLFPSTPAIAFRFLYSRLPFLSRAKKEFLLSLPAPCDDSSCAFPRVVGYHYWHLTVVWHKRAHLVVSLFLLPGHFERHSLSPRSIWQLAVDPDFACIHCRGDNLFLSVAIKVGCSNTTDP